jgi:hypothetical protein
MIFRYLYQRKFKRLFEPYVLKEDLEKLLREDPATEWQAFRLLFFPPKPTLESLHPLQAMIEKAVEEGDKIEAGERRKTEEKNSSDGQEK